MSLIVAEGVVRTFGAVRAVDGLDFRADAGEILSIVGPNGAGKTTLFNLITGVRPLSAGRIRIDGTDITHLPAHRIAELGVARTFQHPRVFPGWSVGENVALGTYRRTRSGFFEGMTGLGRARSDERTARRVALEALERVGLEAMADLSAEQLTTGQERLMDMARALASAPRLLLLDEPAAGLTEEETARLVERLRALGEAGDMAVLLIEHDMSVVFQVSHRVLVINQGKVLSEGTPEDVSRDPEVRRAYLGTGGSDDA